MITDKISTPLDKADYDGKGVYIYSAYYDRQELIKEIGIDILTGEACALSMRLLCELSDNAIDLYLDFYGLRIDKAVIPHSDYNDWSKYSMFLDHKTIDSLIVYYLCHSFPYVQVVTVKPDNGLQSDTLYYCADNGDYIRDFIASRQDLFDHYVCNEQGDYTKVSGAVYGLGRIYSTGNGPRRGFSNVHAMSGVSQ